MSDDLYRQSEARYRSLIELAVDGILLLSHDEVITEANDQMCRIAGRSREELVGQHIRDALFTPESLARAPLRFDRLQQGEIVVGERTVQRPDGSTVDVEMRTRMMPDGTVQSILRDITERKRLIARSLQAEKLESLAVLAGGIAHDFNNLLSGIFGYLELARATAGTPDSAQYLTSASGVIERARALTGQLLTFARGGTPSICSGELWPFLEETVRFSLSGSAISCRFDIADGIWRSRFDRNQLAQVIDNLVRNAEQAMPSGGTLTVTARNRTLGDHELPPLGAGRYVMIAIRDTGVGIPREIQQRIFDPFFTTKQKGHGLGLATSYSIVAQHGGVIAVESAPGEGSTFTVHLPACDDVPAESPLSQPQTHRGAGRMLVLDDEPFMLHIMTALLHGMGYEVTPVRKGEDAIAAYQQAITDQRPFLAAFFDLTVPGSLGGQETAERLRQLGATMPLFVASGYAAASIMSSPTSYGFTDSIAKPFTRQELVTLLERYFPSRP